MNPLRAYGPTARDPSPDYNMPRAALVLTVVACLIHACVAVPPAGCACIGKEKALALLQKSNQHNITEFGDEYGSYCAAWEDGSCSAKSCAWIGRHGIGHTCGTKKGCNDLWPSYNFDTSQSWCCDAWCYVDKSTCTTEIAEMYGLKVEPSWLNVEGLYYSYEACEDDQTFPKDPNSGAGYNSDNKAVTMQSFATYTRETCPYTLQPDGCECLGNNDALGDHEKTRHGQDYGKWCAAWEDGLVTAGDAATVSGYQNGSHTGGGSLGEGCHNHWNDTDFHKPQGWCCDAWCYVPMTCNATKYGIDLESSWTGKSLKFSYGACADWRTRPTLPTTEAAGKVADLAQYSCATCPYSEAFDKTPKAPYNQYDNNSSNYTTGRDCNTAIAAAQYPAGKCTDMVPAVLTDAAATTDTLTAVMLAWASALALCFHLF